MPDLVGKTEEEPKKILSDLITYFVDLNDDVIKQINLFLKAGKNHIFNFGLVVNRSAIVKRRFAFSCKHFI